MECVKVFPFDLMNRGWEEMKPLEFLWSRYDMSAGNGSRSANWGVFQISTTSPYFLGTLGSLIHSAKEESDMFRTSEAKRSEAGGKLSGFSHKISPMRRLPQKATRLVTQKEDKSNCSPFQCLLAECPKSLRKGIETGLWLSEATALTGSLHRFS